MERPHGSSRCFIFVYAQFIKNNKQCHPRVCAICGRADNSFSCSLAGELLEDSYEKMQVIFKQPPNAKFSKSENRSSDSTDVKFWAGGR